MEALLNGVMLAVSLIAGITIGARLARASLGFSKSLGVQIFAFIAICIASIYLAEHPITLVCVVTLLASTVASWIGTKGAPEKGTPYQAYSGHASAVDNPMKVDARDNPFDRRHSNGAITESRWAFPLGHFRRAKRPSRRTPTGNLIKLVAVSDTVPQGKRKTANLTTVK